MAIRIFACSPRPSRPTTTLWRVEFVLLDNFYVESEVSADGHEWSMGAYATDFVERIWPLGYRGDRRVPYPVRRGARRSRPAGRRLPLGQGRREGGELSQLRRMGRQRQARRPIQRQPRSRPSRATSIPCFRSFDMDYPDVKRTDRFLQELAEFEKTGEMPRLVILRLPNDHTSGTTPGKWTVTACVGDNDLALGRVVEGLSKSRFWKNMAIFVVEDDAQNGSDHVDAHRTVALAISPYIKHHSVDSTLYSTSSMLRTMELILGLEPMSQFDAAARPMFNAFIAQPDFTPYVHRPARVDLNAQKHAAGTHGRSLDAPRPGSRGSRRRSALQRDHLEGRQRSRRGHASAGPRGLCLAASLTSTDC